MLKCTSMNKEFVLINGSEVDVSLDAVDIAVTQAVATVLPRQPNSLTDEHMTGADAVVLSGGFLALLAAGVLYKSVHNK